MSWKSVYISVILGIVGVFLFVQERALASEVYFTPTEIKGQIIRAIEECKESVDIAALDITSHEILNALIKAQDQGVRIRIVVDRKRALRKGPLSNQYKNKEFAIKVLVQKGIMHNNFAILIVNY
ncbi:MAG: phospholipase D-like domain-containing protein [Candidatus Brocadiales bacterium]|nr:phospholipase D-like domain-containing protein [Candidatus Brocadiales bacterium]